MKTDQESFGDSDLGQGLGCAAVILAVCIGIGGCSIMVRVGDALVGEKSEPVNITVGPAPTPIEK